MAAVFMVILLIISLCRSTGGSAHSTEWLANAIYSNSVMWCECWDTDDDDYYSWIDANYIDFYDERPTKQITTVTITHTAAVTDTTTVTALFAAVMVIIIAISVLLIALITKKGKAVTVAPDMSSVKEFNNRSNNNISTQIERDLFCVNCGTQYNNQ